MEGGITQSKRSTSKKIANALISSKASVLMKVLIAFFLSPFLVHTLGDTRYGIWTIIAALSGYMCLLDLGIVSALTKYSSKYYQTNDINKLNTIASTCLTLFLIITSTVIVISPFLARGMVNFLSIDPELTEMLYSLIIIVSFDISLFVISGTFRGLFAGFLRHDIISFTVILSSLYKALMFWLFLSHEYGLLAMGVISASANAIAIAIYYLFLRKKFSFITFKLSYVNMFSVKKVLFFSRFTFLAMLANQIIFYSDSLIIGYFLGAAAVTYYTIPWSLIEHVKTLCFAVSTPYITVFSEHDALGDRARLYTSYVSATKYMLAFSNLLCIGMMIFGEAFISIWMGPKYGDLGQPIIIMFALLQLIRSPQLISQSMLQGLNRHKLFSYLSLLVSVINVVGSIILVQTLGIFGVALATAVPQILLYTLFVPYYTTRQMGVSFKQYIIDTYLKFLTPSLALAATLIWFLIHSPPSGFAKLFLQAGSAAGVYLILLYCFSLNPQEKQSALSMLLKLNNKVLNKR